MHTKSLDLLEKTELPAPQARAILQVMELELADRDATIATKSDLKEALHSLELKIESIKTEIQSVKGELGAEMHAIEGRLSSWVLKCILGHTVVVLGVIYFVLSNRK